LTCYDVSEVELMMLGSLLIGLMAGWIWKNIYDWMRRD